MQKISFKPQWLNKKINLKSCREVKLLLRSCALHTVCEESLCPNISECFSSGVATFMILGDICTRNCTFCSVKKGSPKLVDRQESRRVAQAVKKLNLNYVVITSPTRDDLLDGGASIFTQTVKEIKKINPKIKAEFLIPDFLGKKSSLREVAFSGVDVIGHNVETAPSLYIKVRPQANYELSLEVLDMVKKINPCLYIKSSLMLGLGEDDSEVEKVFSDLRSIDCDFLTLGQYLPPSLKHYPVKKYITPDKFNFFKEKALKLGFKAVHSAPYVRSSYLADGLFKAKSL